mgnify:CR=1 FL=1
MSKPIVAVVGRPNVGKSTLFNKLCGQRLAIVEDTPGITRDRIFANCEWNGHEFLLVDTGGIGRRLGEGRTVLIGLCLILLGTVLRSTAGIPGLFLGTAIVGVGTAIGNVLLPAVVKAEYPTRVGQVTAYFTVAMVAAAAIGLALNVPLSTAGLGWNGALMIWGIAVVITGFIWRKNVSLRLGTTDPAEAASDQKPIWKSGLAWCVTLYFGINSLIFYAVIG